jgi:large subunit ribosomal protein L9
MKVILISDDENLGKAGQIVNVKDGFARNYLIPKKGALPATPANLKKVEQMKKQMEAIQVKALTEAQNLAQRIESVSLTLPRQAGEQEKLFGSVTSMDIERALRDSGVEVDRRKIQLHEPIKILGVYDVPIKLHSEVTAQVKVRVVQA